MIGGSGFIAFCPVAPFSWAEFRTESAVAGGVWWPVGVWWPLGVWWPMGVGLVAFCLVAPFKWAEFRTESVAAGLSTAALSRYQLAGARHRAGRNKEPPDDR